MTDCLYIDSFLYTLHIYKPGKKKSIQTCNSAHLSAVHLDVGHIVLEHGGNVHLGELVFAEHDEEAGLPTGAVAHDHQLLPDSRHLEARQTQTRKSAKITQIWGKPWRGDESALRAASNRKCLQGALLE